MCTFDAPISRCEAMRVMVITDQTQRQCACEHECPDGMVCPLLGCFSGVELAVQRPTRWRHAPSWEHALAA